MYRLLYNDSFCLCQVQVYLLPTWQRKLIIHACLWSCSLPVQSTTRARQAQCRCPPQMARLSLVSPALGGAMDASTKEEISVNARTTRSRLSHENFHLSLFPFPFSLLPTPYLLPTYLRLSLSIMSPPKVTSKDSSEDGRKSLLLPTYSCLHMPTINVGAICSLSVLFYAR